MVNSERSILIVTPLPPPDSGGPATYSQGLLSALEEKGVAVDLVTFKPFLRYPTGIRHVLFFFTVLKRMKHADRIIVLDTVSVALPTICAALLRRKKLYVRIGGDFVWERFIERTKKKIPLSLLYTSNQPLSMKEKMLIWAQRNLVCAYATRIIFSTHWQRDIWTVPYQLPLQRVRVIENAYAAENVVLREFESRLVAWIGRDIVLKNVDTLDRVMARVQREFPSTEYKKYTGINHTEVMGVLLSARVLVIPSVSEVSPNLALEAIRAGVPVLLTRDCGLRDVLGDSVIWIDPLDEHDVYTHLARLMEPDGYARAQKNARAFRSTRTYAEVAQEFLDL